MLSIAVWVYLEEHYMAEIRRNTGVNIARYKTWRSPQYFFADSRAFADFIRFFRSISLLATIFCITLSVAVTY
jgi:hypothetical protein